ncbi:MAG: O-antigen ligase family protein [Candidatus Rokubacteria bacterium]|nr:O-antigen ligase family protein [Candidatus Rokubacteria bacterium]
MAFSSAGSGRDTARVLLFGVLILIGAFFISQGIARVRMEMAFALALAFGVFILVFMRTEAGLYFVLLSMLLSPELSVGGGDLSEGRQGLVLRLEDLLLMVIGVSWFAKMSMNKEAGLTVKTALNRPIVAYIAVTAMATVLGYLTGSVQSAGGFFYVLKYVEYFVVYYMTINHLRDRSQMWRLVMTALVTAAIVSVVGIAQIPSGQRVTAPFEGEVGEPNTFGGYLLLMMGVAAGIALETRRAKFRLLGVAFIGLAALPFAFTLSRASYLGVIPLVIGLALLSSQRRFMVGILLLMIPLAPIVGAKVVPTAVKNRLAETFRPEAAQVTVKIGGVEFDPSTSERLVAMRKAVRGWIRRPVLGYGVTGFAYMDAQYARTLVETGLVGFVTFGWLIWVVVKSGVTTLRVAKSAEERGLALGFVAGTLGLLGHAFGSNTFIIVRIMEPFWFFAAVVAALPMLPEVAAPPPSPPQRLPGFVPRAPVAPPRLPAPVGGRRAGRPF